MSLDPHESVVLALVMGVNIAFTLLAVLLIILILTRPK